MAAAGTPDDNIDDDNLDDVLTDDDLESEIELVSVLVVAATSSDRPLPQAEVDRLLGVGLKEDGPAAGSGS
ncbi:MAG TPA: hypothetical protein VFE92_01325 [Dermatophilaceae bacterium]|jgi:hypothetical protein|nr:hypothetical protein [Dermatophilaceae bacterium]